MKEANNGHSGTRQCVAERGGAKLVAASRSYAHRNVMRERAVRFRYDFVLCRLRSERRPRRVERLVQRFHRLGAPCAEVAKVVVPRRTGADSRRESVPCGGCERLLVHTKPPRVRERTHGTQMVLRWHGADGNYWPSVPLSATHLTTKQICKVTAVEVPYQTAPPSALSLAAASSMAAQ